MPQPPRLLTAFGETLPIGVWAERCGVPAETIRCRIDQFGWPAEKAVSTPTQAKFRPGGRPKAVGPRPCPVPREKAGQSYCEWEHLGRRHCRSFGPWGSDAAANNYRRFAAAWLASGPGGAAGPGAEGASVAHLLTRWLAHCDHEYVKNGRPTKEPGCCRLAAKPLNALYGDTPAAAFGPVELRAVRDGMIAKGWSRKTINIMVSRLVRCWKWGVAEGLVPVAAWQALTALPWLKKGRGVPDRPKKRPPPEADVDALLAFLDADPRPRGRTVAVLVRAQRHLGCRPGELCRLEAAQLDRPAGAGVWKWTIPADKSEHLDRGEKVAYVGPRAQAVLGPLLDRHPDGRVFRWPRGKGAGAAVTRPAYGTAVRQACRRAGVPAFGPHQLRHLRATKVAGYYQSLDHAASAIGDTPGMTAAVYLDIDPDERRKMDVARELG